MDKRYKYTSGSMEDAIPMMASFRLPFDVLCFDTETTGKKADGNFITQLSAVKVTFNTDFSFSITDSKGWLIKPPIPVPKELEDLHIGPTNEQLKDCPSWDEVFPEIDSFFGTDSVLLAHNTPFDLSFMEKMYATTSTVKMTADSKKYNDSTPGRVFQHGATFDTLPIARSIYLETKNHKLGDLVNALGLKKDLKALCKNGKFHDADTDVMATILLFQREIKDWDRLMSRKKVVPYIGDCFQFNSRVDEEGNVVPVKHIAVSTRFYTIFGELRYTHVPRQWAADFDLGLVDMLRFEQSVLKYTGCSRIADIKKFDPKAKRQENSQKADIGLLA